ncbi:MAG: tRNA 2-thiouridine(34) synthase MnmA [Verrucomicrobiota bacterium]
MEKILVGLSGGVDSAVAAGLLVEQGHEVTGAYMKNWINADDIPGECPWEQDVADAQQVAEHLGIPFRVVDLTREYQNKIVNYLLDGYEKGITPNPDVMCNREMKFGVFRTYAEAEGFAAVATGHYAQRQVHEDGSVDLLEGADPHKDQSYFLAMMTQEQLRAARFPIGHLEKPAVREKARELKLPVAEKKDSQGICFIGQVKMQDFLRAYVPDQPGKIINLAGEQVGQHSGLHLFTLGQRKGIGVASPHHGEAYVVVEKRSDTKELVIALDREESPGLYARGCRIGQLNWTRQKIDSPATLLARPRYRAKKEEVYLSPESDHLSLTFAEPQRALAPGQICAFYDDSTLVGGGVFQEIYAES